MRNLTALIPIILLSLMAGCTRTSTDRGDGSSTDVGASVIWIEKGIESDGFVIDVGYRDTSQDTELWLEPVASISRGKTPVANAMVFASLISIDGNNVIAEEVATVYESTSSARYSQGRLRVPEGTSECLARFRIVLPDRPQAWTKDLTLQLGAK